MNPFTQTLTFDRETKNTVRYAAEGEEENPSTLYVSKRAFEGRDYPDRVLVEVREAEDGE